ncbi:hypothetical protein DDT91_14415 [Algoriphagus sp. AK58]|nr:hypothetical protein [Algoriphagus sp. AK58]
MIQWAKFPIINVEFRIHEDVEHIQIGPLTKILLRKTILGRPSVCSYFVKRALLNWKQKRN